ncbi:MAG: lipopolysaccharide assembly protein LapA domain-containing protein [bacterium]
MGAIKKLLVVLLAILSILLGASVMLENPQTLSVVLLGYPVNDVPLGVWLLGALLVGGVAGILVSLPPLIALKAKNKRLAKQLQQTQASGSRA